MTLTEEQLNNLREGDRVLVEAKVMMKNAFNDQFELVWMGHPMWVNGDDIAAVAPVMICPECRISLNAGVSNCPNCGQATEPRAVTRDGRTATHPDAVMFQLICERIPELADVFRDFATRYALDIKPEPDISERFDAFARRYMPDIGPIPESFAHGRMEGKDTYVFTTGMDRRKGPADRRAEGPSNLDDEMREIGEGMMLMGDQMLTLSHAMAELAKALNKR